MVKKNEWFWIIFAIVVVWGLDRVSKEWAENLDGVKSYGNVIFSLHHNHGAMLGLFSDLPQILRIVSLSTGGAFLFCIYAMIQMLLPVRAIPLRLGMSILLGGILGNVTDRIIYGYVIDFLVFRYDRIMTPAFNVSDALQWVGYLMILYMLVRDSQILWPESDVRRVQWVKKQFQLKYCFLLLGVGLAMSLIAIVFSYTYLRVTVLTLSGENQKVLDKFLDPYLITFSMIAIVFCVGLFMAGKSLSHKMAGPIYAYEKYMNELMAAHKSGQTVRKFRLRKNDDFKELEVIAENLRQAIGVPLHEKPEALPAAALEIAAATKQSGHP
jgi:signal peptidase II